MYFSNYGHAQNHETRSRASKLVLKAFNSNENICAVEYAKEYIRRKASLELSDRNNSDQHRFFVSVRTPHGPVTASTIARWVLHVMNSAGIDTNKFKAHSTRGAGTSAAKGLVPIDIIMASGGWSSINTFSKFYDRPVSDNQSLGGAIVSRF